MAEYLQGEFDTLVDKIINGSVLAGLEGQAQPTIRTLAYGVYAAAILALLGADLDNLRFGKYRVLKHRNLLDLTQYVAHLTAMDKLPHIWKRGVPTGDENAIWGAISQFISELPDHDFLHEEFEVALKSDAVTVAKTISALFTKPRISARTWDDVVCFGYVDGKPTLLHVHDPRRHARGEADIAKFRINIYGRQEEHNKISAYIDKIFAREKYAEIHWHYRGRNEGTHCQIIFLPPLITVLRPEFYPDLPDPQSFINEYLQSEASILMLAGPPGTGKTTLLRHMICERNLQAHVCYDELMLNSDGFFQSFLFGSGDLLILEDADTMLTSREQDHNRMMSRFLNVSDGLIKLPNKKIVFTTNLSDFGRVDAALLRPGRCFGVVHTRPLNLKEAQHAAKVSKLPVPADDRREYTIADLFNQRGPRGPRKIGFVA